MSLVPVLMITLRNSLRILGKAIIVGGAVFYSYDQGIWSSGDHTENHAKLIRKQAEENVFAHIPLHKVIPLNAASARRSVVCLVGSRKICQDQFS